MGFSRLPPSVFQPLPYGISISPSPASPACLPHGSALAVNKDDALQDRRATLFDSPPHTISTSVLFAFIYRKARAYRCMQVLHFCSKCYTFNVTINRHMLDIQIPLYAKDRPRTKGQAGIKLLPLGPGGCHWLSPQADWNSTRKCI